MVSSAAPPLTSRHLVALVVVRATSCAGFFAVLPYLGLWLVESRGLSGADAGLVVGAAILANRAGGVLMVPLVQRIGLKASVGLGYLGAVAVFTLLGAGLSLPVAGWLVLAALAGLFLAAATTAMKAQIAAFDAGQRLRGFSYLNMAVNAGSALGPLLGGQLLEWHADRLPLGAAALDAVALLAVPALPGRWRAADRPAGGGARERILPGRRFAVFSLLVCGTWLAYAQVFDVLPTYLHTTVSTGRIGLVFTVNAILVIVLQVPVSALSRRVLAHRRGGFGPLCCAANVVLAAAVLLFAAGRFGGLGLVLAAMVVFTLSELVWSPLYDVEVSERRGGLSATAAYAVAGVAWGAAESAGAWLGLLLVAGDGGGHQGWLLPSMPYWAAAALALVTGAALLRGRERPREPDEHRENTGSTDEVDLPARA
ncbi:MFS transporter [Streptomyces sp. NPDC059398]|uniref:MFS transporter n=1 Tax=Streptomyces sp. NPDC059398 TaxID=3346820 RepID=UPI0036A8C835